MKFSRFRLTGFKSFVEPTEVSIEAGLTGVVGPNGCGKSNLVEALQWVMGENSYKAMRGSGMEDVIFSGSVARPARNAAEVSLALDNTDRGAPAAFNDADIIDVSRRIERDAGSSYRINGREVRARDVQLLFADASIGAHSAAIVGQGRVGSLISAKPEIRRGILEEAAGIHGLFGRRHEAELRLKAADQNLERLEDVLAEIERQLEGLRRQARQAIRYRTLSGEIRKAEATALAVRHSFAADTVASAEAELAAAVAKVTDGAEQHAKASRDQAAAATITPALRDQAAAAEASVQRVRIEADRLESEERTAREQIGELQQRMEQLAADLERERTLLRDSAETLARHREEQVNLATESEGQDTQRSKAGAALEHAETALTESERLMAEAATALADLRARRSRTQTDADEAAAREGRLQIDRERIKEERDDLSTHNTSRLGDALESQELAAQTLTKAEKATIGAEAATAAARDRAAALTTDQTEAEARLARMQTEAAALRSLLPVSDVRSPLIESVEARDGTEFALAALLDDELNLSTNPEDDAFWLQIGGTADPELPADVQKLSDLVDAPAELTRRLTQTGVVTADEGTQLQKALRPGQTLVSREGDLWRWDGLVASSATRKNAAERLSGRRRLAELVIEIAGSQPIVAEGAAQMRVARQAGEAAAQEESRCREAWRIAQKELDAARNEVVAAEREQAGRTSRLAALAEADSRLAADIVEVSEIRKSAAEILGEMALPSAIETPMEALRQKVAADRNAVAEARMSVAEIDRAGHARDARIASLEREEDAWTKRRIEVENQIASLVERRAVAAGQRDILDGKPEAIAAQRTALMERSGEAEATRNSAGDALAEAEAALASADKVAAEANQRLSAAREQRGRLEERLGGAKERLAEIGNRIRESLQCEPSEATELAGLSGDNLPALDQVEARLERLKQERERLGGVNLQADAEAEELASRRDGMVVEKDDLVAAINKLRQGIGNLNREGRERLTAAFENVNREFQRLFVHLFGGGTAELKLVGSDDPLEAGLEVIAKPPGKKPQTMTLLSGGEQALTALSLIFAVFLTNPAPVCVLDEVDAPLDDANVERLCALLDEITRQTDTRFLVITHNPITMARMNRLFGVTMTERGVSQLVSVDLETAEQFLEAS